MTNKIHNSQGEYATERHPLQPFLPATARALMLGSFPPPRERWTMEFYYPNFNNDMWRVFGLVFFGDKDHFVDCDRRSFNEAALRRFLSDKGIALYDTSEEVIRLKGNASDQFLEIVKPVDLPELLAHIPQCRLIVTTGQKAAETLAALLRLDRVPSVGDYVDTFLHTRPLRCYRMPSSSRAYPRPLVDKAADYRRMFANEGFVEL